MYLKKGLRIEFFRLSHKEPDKPEMQENPIVVVTFSIFKLVIV